MVSFVLLLGTSAPEVISEIERLVRERSEEKKRKEEENKELNKVPAQDTGSRC